MMIRLPKGQMVLLSAPAIFWESPLWMPSPLHGAVTEVIVCVKDRFKCPTCLCAGGQSDELVDGARSAVRLEKDQELAGRQPGIYWWVRGTWGLTHGGLLFGRKEGKMTRYVCAAQFA